MRPSAEQLAPLWPHLERCDPAEGCAVLWAGPLGFRLQILRNALPPGRAGRGFALDDGEWLAALRAAEAAGEWLHWIIHSHVATPPLLSDEDRATARLYPGAAWLVVQLLDGRVDACALHPAPAVSSISGGLAGQ